MRNLMRKWMHVPDTRSDTHDTDGAPKQNETERDVAAPPVAPPLPMAKRLNRNALTVAAVIMGVTVLVAVVTLNTRRQPAPTLRCPRPRGHPFSMCRPAETRCDRSRRPL